MSIDKPRSLRALFDEVKRHGFRVSNLFHRMDGLFQANLRSSTAGLTFEFAYGPSPEDALERALAKAWDGRIVPHSAPKDDERDPRQVGGTKECVRPVPEDEEFVIQNSGLQNANESETPLRIANTAEADEDEDLVG